MPALPGHNQPFGDELPQDHLAASRPSARRPVTSDAPFGENGLNIIPSKVRSVPADCGYRRQTVTAAIGGGLGIWVLYCIAAVSLHCPVESGNSIMAFCTNCGNKMPDDARFCATCGQAVGAVPGTSVPPPPPPSSGGGYAAGARVPRFRRSTTRFRATTCRWRGCALKAGQEVFAEAGRRCSTRRRQVFWETRMQGEGIGQKIWGALKRKLMGESLFMTYFRAMTDGEVGFAGSYPGRIQAFSLRSGRNRNGPA